MKKRPTNHSGQWLAGAFLAGLLAVGIPYWSTAYYKLSLPDTLLEYAVVPLAIIALVTPFLCAASTTRIAMVLGSTVPAAVLMRIFGDLAQNPATHNLWPIELVIAFVVGMLVAWPATAIGGILRYARLHTRWHV